MKVKSESEVAQSCPTLRDPMNCSLYQAPPSMGFSRQEYWSGVPLPSPMTKLDSILKKQRHYFADKGPYSQSYGFFIVTYGCESWTINKLSTEELMLLNCGVGEDS